MKLEFHPLADQELTDAATFYENAEAGLGAEFLDEIERLLTVLRFIPTSEGRLRRTSVWLQHVASLTVWFTRPYRITYTFSP